VVLHPSNQHSASNVLPVDQLPATTAAVFPFAPCSAAANLLQDVKVATALNWQMFCGCVAATNPEPGSFDPLRYNASFAREFAQVKQYAMPYVKEFKVRTCVMPGDVKVQSWVCPQCALLHFAGGAAYNALYAQLCTARSQLAAGGVGQILA
jgi:hypothetical protein